MEQGRKKRRWLHIPSPAMIVACVALFVALGGTSYAAIVLPANSVGTKQIKKSAVTSAKVKTATLTGAKMKDATLTGVKVKDGSLLGADLAAGVIDTTKIGALPGARVRSTATQSIPNSTVTALSFNTVDANSGGVFAASQPTRLTAPVAGTYLITACVAWANDAVGSRQLWVQLNGSTSLVGVFERPAADNTLQQNVATTYHLNAGDYVSAAVWQNSGSPLDSWNAPNDAPVLTMNWIAP
jgi:hypothetical protein